MPNVRNFSKCSVSRNMIQVIPLMVTSLSVGVFFFSHSLHPFHLQLHFTTTRSTSSPSNPFQKILWVFLLVYSIYDIRICSYQLKYVAEKHPNFASCYSNKAFNLYPTTGLGRASVLSSVLNLLSFSFFEIPKIPYVLCICT